MAMKLPLKKRLKSREETIRDDLFSHYDRLNELLDEAESRLLSLHVPKPVEHCYKRYAEGDSDIECYLGIHYYGGKKRLCWCSASQAEEYELRNAGYDPTDTRFWNWKAVRDCSIEVRIEAVEYLEGLRDAILEAQELFVPEVAEAIGELEAKLDQLGPAMS